MSLLQDKNFQTRAITGALFVGVIVACIFINNYTFIGLLAVINFFCLREFYNLTIEEDQKFFKGYILFVGMVLILVLMLILPYVKDFNPRIIFIVLLLPFSILFVPLFSNSPKPFTNLGLAFLGLIYITVPLYIFYDMTSEWDLDWDPRDNYRKYTFDGYPKQTLLFFLLVWVNDTGAYITGKLFGRTKLFERISPKKTWEGTIGGVTFCIILAPIYATYIILAPIHGGAEYIKGSDLVFYAGLGLVIGVFSTLGDLLESQLKRSLNIKDSGNILPGHGGFLDRFDGFLIAMPAAFFYEIIVALNWTSFFHSFIPSLFNY